MKWSGPFGWIVLEPENNPSTFGWDRPVFFPRSEHVSNHLPELVPYLHRQTVGRVAVGHVGSSLAQGPGVAPAVSAVQAHPTGQGGYQVDAAWPTDGSRAEFGGAVSAIDIDSEGMIWVLGRSPVPVRVYDSQGALIRSWGSGVFTKPHGLGFDREGHVWITDVGDHTVRKFDSSGNLLQTLGNPGKAGADSTHFDQPTDVAIGPDRSIWVSDGYGNNRMVQFDPAGQFLQAVGSKGTGPGQFRLPHAVVIDDQGRLYVADRSNGRVQVFDGSGRFLREWAGVMMPWDLAITPDNMILACGSSPMSKGGGFRLTPPGIPPLDQVVMKFDTEGRVRDHWTFPRGDTKGQLDWVHGLATDRDGVIYLGDIMGRRAQKFRAAVTTVETENKTPQDSRKH